MYMSWTGQQLRIIPIDVIGKYNLPQTADLEVMK